MSQEEEEQQQQLLSSQQHPPVQTINPPLTRVPPIKSSDTSTTTTLASSTMISAPTPPSSSSTSSPTAAPTSSTIFAPTSSITVVSPDNPIPNLPSSKLEHDNHLQFLMDALEKLDPNKNGLCQVPKDITSSTLTTRLRGVCKINRLIDHANDLCHSFNEIGAKPKYIEYTDRFRDWILKKNIIEHIFGPNCHVEIIKQSHSILNFVAYSLEDEHVNVIWSASSLKHCGRQVLDLLTSLVRFMRTGPVLHLYRLVKNLNVVDHTEHTLLLTSHILRFIWSHSPCINQVHFCSLQKNRLSPTDQENDPHSFDIRNRYSPIEPVRTSKILQQQEQTVPESFKPKVKSFSQDRSNEANEENKIFNTSQDNNVTANTASTTTSTNEFSLSYGRTKSEDDDIEWYNECINQSRLENTFDDQSTERSISSRSTSENEIEKELHQTLLEAIGASQHKALNRHNQKRSNSPSTGDTSKKIAEDSGNSYQSCDGIKKSAVDHQLKVTSIDHSSEGNDHSSQQPRPLEFDYVEPMESSQNQPENESNESEWLQQWKVASDPFLEYSSDVSACCSEDKNMDDFDDEAQNFMQDENTNGNSDGNSGEIFARITSHLDHSKKSTLKETNRSINRELFESTSTTRDSDSKIHPSLDPSTEHFQQRSAETVANFVELKKASMDLSNITSQMFADEDLKRLSEYNLANLSEHGKTLLWDLLQDGKIEQLAVNLYAEIENALVNLVMSFGDKYIRYKFIEACLENLAAGKSVIISLRLLPRFMSFNTMTRSLSLPAVNETYTIVLWAEREHNMSKNYFKNLVTYYENQKRDSSSNLTIDTTLTCAADSQKLSEAIACYTTKNNELFSHIESIITRMSFLTFIYSKPFSPVNMKLNREQMDQLWDCLTSDENPRCSDVLFQWIYQQAMSDDFHGVDEELMDYVLRCKLPTLEPENFRLRGLKLLEQLLWNRQDFECCHELEHPATRLLWDIALKAVDDEVSMSAIRILNHFYIYTNHQKPMICKKGTNFMHYCMEHLRSTLAQLKCSSDSRETSQLLDVMHKVILLIRTHLEVFRAHWSFYLRILQLNNEADLISHRLNAYDIKLTMTIRLVVQAASSINKTTIEVQASDFIGELRAEVIKWWYSQVERGHFEQSTALSPSSSSSSASASSTSTNQSGELVDNQPNSCGKFYAESSRTRLDSFTRFLLNNHHSLRLLSQNQEIPFDWDERQINELDFKDMQVIYVLNDVKPTSADYADDLESEKSEESPQSVYFPELTTIPSIVLQGQDNFECLMEVDRFLGLFDNGEEVNLTSRAKALSRRVWEIIQILPTNPHYKEDLKHCGLDEDNDINLKMPKCSHLLNSSCPQRLLYSLQIIDILKSSPECPYWGAVFIRKGGLADLYDVFMSQELLPCDIGDWNEWLQECLAYLLKLLFQFGTRANSSQTTIESASSSSRLNLGFGSRGHNSTLSSVGSLKRLRRNRNRAQMVTEERVFIPSFSDELLQLLEDTDLIFEKLFKILKSSALSSSQNDHYYYVTISSRAMIVQHVMSFISSWCKSDPKFPEIGIQNHENLLKALILDDTDPSTRREACNGFFKLHYACLTRSLDISIDSSSTTSSSPPASENQSDTSSVTVDHNLLLANNHLSADLLSCLIRFLPIAESMKPPKPMRTCITETDYIRELNLPGCKDYFWLTCRLIDAPNTCFLNHRKRRRSPSKNEDRNTSSDSGSNKRSFANDKVNEALVDLHDLCKYLMSAIRKRPTYETRDYAVEDDTLRGMLQMMVMAIRRDPAFRYTDDAQRFIPELYGYLFAPPNEQLRHLPKCKAGATRSTAFDLMIALVEQCPKNYVQLLELLLHDQHQAVVKGLYPTDYWPHDDCRSEVGFVGLINLGATCYLATCVQHLFMIPDLRYAILSIQDPKSIRHGEIIRELQKIFAFMLESERKAYNPRNFCKVYTMDNHPLNIAEQTDMTEFLTDLITKIEESSPVLRQIIKSLFSGTLSNNVVSLDCSHISRTTEEFYTLRVQVADMRNLNDSLDELTVKDTLEGDNMYTCSSCERKVRAEKRACIVKLPRILCFNTMRYTFNMATMTKEKVNTHFSFPLTLDMSDYLETNLMKRQQTASPTSSSCPSRNSTSSSTSPSSKMDPSVVTPSEENNNINEKMMEQDEAHSEGRSETVKRSNTSIDQSSGSTTSASNKEEHEILSDCDSNTLYELIGVTVHTGNADGGHYYCFIRDCEDNSTDKPRWYLFNDAEVKPFDDSHIGTECYGGELTTKSYDAINDRFMDFSIEKTNSAYMLFYKRVDYKYRSKSVASRYLESDTERNITTSPVAEGGQQLGYLQRAFSGCQVDQPMSPAKKSASKTISYLGGESSQQQQQHNMKDVVELVSAGTTNECNKMIKTASERYARLFMSESFDFDKLCQLTYEDFVLPRHLANWIWTDNIKFSRDQFIFEHNYFDFMWQICANVPRTLNQLPKGLLNAMGSSNFVVHEDNISIQTVHLAILFVLGVLMNSRERPNLSNWTELIRKHFNSSRAACDWLMQLIDDDETWLKQMLLRCPIEMVRQLFQRLCNDLTGGKQHKKIRLVK